MELVESLLDALTTEVVTEIRSITFVEPAIDVSGISTGSGASGSRVVFRGRKKLVRVFE